MKLIEANLRLLEKQENSVSLEKASRDRSGNMKRQSFPWNSSDVDGRFHLHKLVEICLSITTSYTERSPLRMEGVDAFMCVSVCLDCG